MRLRCLMIVAVTLGGCTQANPAFDEPSGDTSSTGTAMGTTASPTGTPGSTTAAEPETTSSTAGTTAAPASTGSTEATTSAETSATTGTSGTTGTDTDGCEPPEILCGAECVNTATDRNHCGACDRVCPGNQECVESDCQGGPGG